MRWCKGAHRGHKRKGPDIHNLTFAVKIIRKFTFPKNGELIKPCDVISLNVNLAKYRGAKSHYFAQKPSLSLPILESLTAYAYA